MPATPWIRCEYMGDRSILFVGLGGHGTAVVDWERLPYSSWVSGLCGSPIRSGELHTVQRLECMYVVLYK